MNSTWNEYVPPPGALALVVGAAVFGHGIDIGFSTSHVWLITAGIGIIVSSALFLIKQLIKNLDFEE